MQPQDSKPWAQASLSGEHMVDEGRCPSRKGWGGRAVAKEFQGPRVG